MDKRVEQLESELETLRKDFSDISQSLKNIAKQKSDEAESRMRRAYHQAADRAQDAWDNISSSGEEYYHHAREYLDDGMDSLNECVRDKPLQSLAVVAGIGFLIGFLTRR